LTNPELLLPDEKSDNFIGYILVPGELFFMGYWQEEELRRTKKILTGSKTALIAVIITVFTLVLGGQ
jgi:hypothetical protein